MEFKQIKVIKIEPSPFNPRKNFGGRKFEELILSIKEKGVIEPNSVCLDKECLKSHQERGRQKKKKNGAASGGGPRVSWHGEFFREKFYQNRLPEVFKNLRVSVDMPDAVEKKDRLALFALLKSNRELHEWFAEKTGQESDWYLNARQLFAPLETMTIGELGELLKEATLKTVIQSDFGPDGRRLVANHLGVDLKSEWRIDEEYLDKKTKREIIDIGEKFKIFEQPEVRDFLFNVLMKKNGNYKGCKKPELKRLFLESGADLAGVVPDEITDMD